MLFYLVGKSGRIRELNISHEHKNELLKAGYRMANPKERVDFIHERIKRNKKKFAELKRKYPDFMDVHFLCGSRINDGYGVTSKLLARELEKNNIFLNRELNGQKVGLIYSYPYMIDRLQTPYKIIYTMFESSKMPDDWGEYLRKANLVIVPSEFCRMSMLNQFGIDPVVIPLGYDQEVYKFVKRKRDQRKDPFTFLHYDAFKNRKGWDLILKAFNEEFGKTDFVKLIFKTTLKQAVPLDYDNIETIKGDFGNDEMMKLIGKADCFVYPSRGEGFGLPPLEAMATGIPTIQPRQHGLGQYFNHNVMYKVNTKPCKAVFANPHFDEMDLGVMRNCSVKSLRSKMRLAYDDWKANRKPFRTPFNIHQHARNYTIAKTGGKLADLIKKETTEHFESKNKIVFLTEDTEHITGGRYYSWWLATALKAIGYDVVIYTNRIPAFIDDFLAYPQPRVKIVNSLLHVDTPAKMYFGSPILGSTQACKLGEKYNKPVYCEIFDPFPMMEHWKDQGHHPTWNELIPLMKNKRVNIISLCEYANRWIYDWLNKRKGQVKVISPCINSKAKDQAKQKKKKDWAVFVSRLCTHKNIDHVLDAIKKTNLDLHIITSVDEVEVDKMIKERGMEDRVKIHWFISDVEKFELIKQAKVTINASSFEGYGMFISESLACKVPVVCYDYPTFREIASEFRNQKFIYFADYNKKDSLKNALNTCLKDEEIRRERLKCIEDAVFKQWDFKIMKHQLKYNLHKNVTDLKIGVVMCVLNEEKFVKSSLRSVIKHSNIEKVAVVEGCVTLNEGNANQQGLSLDNTAKEICKVINEENGRKIIYDRYGWAGSKSELRNHALKMLGDDMDYILVVDGDEVYKQIDLDKLVGSMIENPDATVFKIKHLHFWKDGKTLTVGSMWDAYLFRCFKYEDKTLHWERHEAPVVSRDGESVETLGKVVEFKKVFVYHYGYMKSNDEVKAKIDYYKKRDLKLTVKDTYSSWKKGEETQPTHQGGTIKKFKGTHPPEMRGLIL